MKELPHQGGTLSWFLWLSHGPCLTYKIGGSCFCPVTSGAEPESDDEVPVGGTTQPGDSPPGLWLSALVSGPLHRVNFYGGTKPSCPHLLDSYSIQDLTQQKGKTQFVLSHQGPRRGYRGSQGADINIQPIAGVTLVPYPSAWAPMILSPAISILGPSILPVQTSWPCPMPRNGRLHFCSWSSGPE